MPRHFISRKEAKTVIAAANELGLVLPEGSMEVEERKKEKCYYIGGKPCLFFADIVFPTLLLLNEIKPARHSLTVDKGAVPHIIKGANVFAQGIVSIDPDLQKDEIVFIRDETGNYIAVGKATRSASDIMSQKKGEAATLIHYPNDRIIQEFGN